MSPGAALRGRAMPPNGMPRPDEATYDSFATYLETELDRAAETNPNPGRPPAHRLNRAEYASAVTLPRKWQHSYVGTEPAPSSPDAAGIDALPAEAQAGLGQAGGHELRRPRL